MSATRNRTDQHVDRGADGPAMAARPFVMATIEDDTAGEDGTRRFTRSEVRRAADGVIEWCVRKGWLQGWRLDAAETLARLYNAGRIAPTGYSGSGGGGGEMSDERAAAWDEYKRALACIPLRCQDACGDVAAGRLPTDANAHRNVPDGFAALVREWKLGPRQNA